MKRRTYLAGAGTAALAGLAGCTGLLGLDKHESNPVGVAAETRNETGYQQSRIDDIVIDKSVDLGLWSESITVTNYVVEHEKAITVGPLIDQRAAVFAVLSTPQISIAGQEVNPIKDMETGELVQRLAANYEGVSGVQHVEDATVSILGESVTTSTFQAQATFGGNQDIDVNLHVTEAAATDEDLVVGVGVYPTALASQERTNVETLLSSIDPSVDVRSE
ncbi:DUF6517 family protein [Halovivax limisalsi]|uniref:DUF6517 family protein n=1 Tax=Halovivax limisalsi TaxID=1453760 RepID=UPI001FFCCF3F|nr:DUF6517 family protein [Halovivax limisalsi]